MQSQATVCGDDPFITAADRAVFEAEMRAAGADWQVQILGFQSRHRDGRRPDAGIFSAHSRYHNRPACHGSVCARDACFAEIDHAGGAADLGLMLPPAELLIFGSARAGTPLMQSAMTAAIDLPLKALAWEDETRATWLGFNDPAWIARRHGAAGAMAIVEAMTSALTVIVKEAVAG